MRHNSEKIKTILSSPEGQKSLDYVSPIYDNAYVALWLYQVIGLELDEMVVWVKNLSDEIVPEKTKLLVSFWEKEYGIPIDETLPLSQRRNILLSKIKTRAPITPYRIRTIVTAACGRSSRVAENVAKNTFHVIISAPGQNGIDETAIKYAIDQIKPAHLIYEIKYEQGVQTPIYAGCFMRVLKTVTLRQVN
mgnify:FL=1